MKKAFKIFGYIIIGLMTLGIVGAILDPDESEDDVVESSFTPGDERFNDSLIQYNIQNREADSLQRYSNIQEKESLEKKFVLKEDEFTKKGWYSHKRWGHYWQKRITVTAHTNTEGFMYIESNYFADDWIFHDRAIFLINGQTYQTTVIPRYDSNNTTKVASGGVYEIVSYLDDHHIAEVIANNVDKEIKVRFQGSEFRKDITLSKGDKQAIADCYKLAELIKKTRDV